MHIILDRGGYNAYSNRPVGVKDNYKLSTLKMDIPDYHVKHRNESTISLTIEGTASSCDHAYPRKATLRLSTPEAQILVNQLAAQIEADRVARIKFMEELKAKAKAKASDIL